MKKIKEWLGLVMMILSIMGLVTFSLFICEEAFQTAMFGTWPAQDAKQWHQVKRGCDVMSGINKTLKIVNFSFGWIQPLAFVSYWAYGDAASFYVESLRIKVFAHCPECFDGESVNVIFAPEAITREEYMQAGRVIVESKLKWKPGDKFRVKGKVDASDRQQIRIQNATVRKLVPKEGE